MTADERFEALYGANAGAVLAYALRRTSAANADDVVAEVFLVAWRRLADVPADERIWLLGVARRVLANQRRSQTRQRALRERLAPQLPSTSAPAAADSRDERVLRALAELREDAAQEERNLMDPLLKCARAHASEGEIVQSLQQVFGDYTETPVF